MNQWMRLLALLMTFCLLLPVAVAEEAEVELYGLRPVQLSKPGGTVPGILFDHRMCGGGGNR